MGIAEAHDTGKDTVPVPTQEDRIAALERKVAMLELLHSQDERKAEEALPPAQARTMKEINENLAILLGVTSSQGGGTPPERYWWRSRSFISGRLLHDSLEGRGAGLPATSPLKRVIN